MPPEAPLPFYPERESRRESPQSGEDRPLVHAARTLAVTVHGGVLVVVRVALAVVVVVVVVEVSQWWRGVLMETQEALIRQPRRRNPTGRDAQEEGRGVRDSHAPALSYLLPLFVVRCLRFHAVRTCDHPERRRFISRPAFVVGTRRSSSAAQQHSRALPHSFPSRFHPLSRSVRARA